MDWEGADETKVEGTNRAPKEQDSSARYQERSWEAGPVDVRSNFKYHKCFTPATLLLTLRINLCTALHPPDDSLVY